MALEDMIARSGAANFETMRQGWLPTPQEKASRRMAELQAQRQEQIIDAEPQRRRLADLQLKTAESEFDYLPTKRKQQEQKFELDVKQTKAVTEKAEYEMGQLKTEDEAKQYIVNQDKIGKHLFAANKLKTNKDKRAYLNRYRDEILAAGDDQEDDAFKAVMQQTGEQFNQSFGLVLQGNKYIQGLAEKRFGKATTLQNLKTKDIKTVLYNDPNYQQKVDEALTDNYIVTKTMGIEQTGSPSSFGLTKNQTGKTIQANAEAYKTGAKAILGLDELSRFVSSPDFAGGVAGDALGVANNFVAQAKNVFGLNIDVTDEKWYDQAIDPSSKEISKWRRMAINDQRFAGALIELAYIKAKTLDKGGRVTDADLRYAKQILQAGADPLALKAMLLDNMVRIERNYNVDTDWDNENYREGKTPFKRMSYKGILSTYDAEYGNDPTVKLDATGPYSDQAVSDEIRKIDAEMEVIRQRIADRDKVK